LFLFSEPDDVKKNKSVEFDPIMCGPIKCMPEGYTCYDKVVVDMGSLTFEKLFKHFEETQKVEVSMVSCGSIALYNAYMPGGKHAARLTRVIEELLFEITQEELPKGRRYLVLELGGADAEGNDF